jgi:predicted GIY-YIG superfamily endonuclease
MIRENLTSIPVTGGIYKFTSKTSGKIYIGSAKNLRKRFVQHRSNLRLNKHHSKHFQNAYNKYGESDFIYSILEELKDMSLLLIREQYYLDTLLFAQEYINHKSNKFLELGYNINPITSNRIGSKQTIESIKKTIENNSRVFPVLQFDFNGNQIGEFISSGEASRSSNVNRNSIWNCCKGNQEYAGKFFFIFKKDYENYIDYFISLKDNPFIPEIWNKGKIIKPQKDDCLIVFDRYGRFINTFAYQTDIAKFINCTTANLSKAKNNKIIKNYYIFDLSFDYKKVIDNIKCKYNFMNNLEQNPNKIMVYDIFDNFISGFESVEIAAELMNMKSNSIYCVLSRKRKQNEGFKFKYYDDIV